MKITLTKKELKRVLGLAYKIIKEVKGGTMPILTNLIITPQAVVVNGWEAGLEIEIDATELEDGVIAMEYDDLKSYFDQADGNITIKSMASYKVKMTCENDIDIDMITEGQDPQLVADESPEAPEPPKKFRNVFKGFHDDIRRCSAYMAQEKMRYALHGIYFKASKTKLFVAGTDGKRAYFNEKKLPKTGNAFEFIAPAIVKSFLNEIDDNTCIAVKGKDKETQFAFFLLANGTLLWTRVLEGEFPHIKEVVPKGKVENSIEFKEPVTKKVLNALKKLKTGEGNAVGLMKKTGKPLEAEATSFNDTQKTTTLKIPCTGKLSPRHGFDKGFLYDILIEKPEKINFYGPGEPMIAFYKNKGKAILMPVRLVVPEEA